MATRARTAPPVKSATAHVLLQHFPRHVHWAMKAEAARRGVLVSSVYSQACALFLAKQAKRKQP